VAAPCAPDKTGEQQGCWQPGQSGNPAGRPKGSRNKLSEEFLRAFAQDFEQHGATVIETVRQERPQDYLRVAASLMPKQMEIETHRPRGLSEYSDEELTEMLANGLESTIERILVARGHAALMPVEREQIRQY
jgi:hypothetical protein